MNFATYTYKNIIFLFSRSRPISLLNTYTNLLGTKLINYTFYKVINCTSLR